MPEIVLDISGCDECCLDDVPCFGCVPGTAAKWKFAISMPFDPKLYMVLQEDLFSACPPGYGVISDDEFVCQAGTALKVTVRSGPSPNGNVVMTYRGTPGSAYPCTPGVVLGSCCCWSGRLLQHTVEWENYWNCDCESQYPPPPSCEGTSGFYEQWSVRGGVEAVMVDCVDGLRTPTQDYSGYHYGELMLTVSTFLAATNIVGDPLCPCFCCAECYPTSDGIFSRAMYKITFPWNCNGPNTATKIAGVDYTQVSQSANIAALFPSALTLLAV